MRARQGIMLASLYLAKQYASRAETVILHTTSRANTRGATQKGNEDNTLKC
jgi:hypothetical protein